ncbi:MAG: hypothetical protein A3E07_01685 [Candidatus Wildermuthbacteria bacterium RIFCSPHIGHO2_12_FULL_45_9]|uniref:Ribulose-phosphate 3-epimerase n=1 Tax=Candidatus Wildermuthbacteria bacterium RIFCSPHIGHO2_02_FULL_45_25 TaxID=1802450 RepID=A0A1G2R6I4_9BACT|nr:MAG: hypothetical protein A2748_01185 [Candidatus Wildermuthbacteria bacterium RIFCSPHIGHO2_01_FULL_45_20]OHA67862.1 MAG: hypothetical protein A3C04_02920 [Candidatus Wildermuthbacteria bacterium RIFCSPHIGHO2_02_FULL_45_25]OHA70200.1 MAG: hypothetical protein A3E07_01685 [Candidatus Wildermuthbacteria bacterium RIFCSPHIGHO2_12_FULL_45_9]
MQKIIPAILTDDIEDLKNKLTLLENHATWVQIDIMDGKFVPNTSVNVAALEVAYEFFSLEIHLMVANPETYFQDCMAIGAKRVIIHSEAAENLGSALAHMKPHAFQKGVAINPQTDVSVLFPYLEYLDSVLILAVTPGFQGQKFLPEVLEKVRKLKELAPDLIVGVDGGVNESNITQVFQAGADYVAVGSALFNTPDPLDALKKLEKIIG